MPPLSTPDEIEQSPRTDGADHPARQAAIDWLLGRINYERTAAIPYNQRQLKLDRMRQLLTRMGQPDAGMKIVHVAGTKGKGSTAAMIAGILSAAGFRTGVFSSPHIEQIEERFAVDGRPCTADELVALVERLRPVVAVIDDEAARAGDPNGGPTFFDLTTALALMHFAERQVDAAVLEVGLGGRLDSTNVCLPVVSVITSISFDHTKQLGHTLAAIAGEKAGIIKPGVPVVSGVTEPEAQQVIADVAREHGCRLMQLGSDFHVSYHSPIDGGGSASSLSPGLLVSPTPPTGRIEFSYTVAGQEHSLDDAPLAMRGQHQAINAAVALATIAELRHQGWCLSSDAMRLGLERTVLPARVEVVPGEPAVVLDAAHNPASIAALMATLAEFPAATRRTLIVSISTDKDVPTMVRTLAPHFDRFIVTQYQDNPRAVPAESLAAMFGDATIHATPHEAWQFARQTAIPGELVCITGSFYLAAEMRPLVV